MRQASPEGCSASDARDKARAKEGAQQAAGVGVGGSGGPLSGSIVLCPWCYRLPKKHKAGTEVPALLNWSFSWFDPLYASVCSHAYKEPEGYVPKGSAAVGQQLLSGMPGSNHNHRPARCTENHGNRKPRRKHAGAFIS